MLLRSHIFWKDNNDYVGRQELTILDLTDQLGRAKQAVPRNGTLAQQETCAGRAELERRKLAASSENTSKVVLAMAVGHYNATMNRCLVRTQSTVERSDGLTRWFFSVRDGFDGKEFGSRFEDRF